VAATLGERPTTRHVRQGPAVLGATFRIRCPWQKIDCDYDNDNDNESDASDAAWLICFTCS
jgi:hypothetical protein